MSQYVCVSKDVNFQHKYFSVSELWSVNVQSRSGPVEQRAEHREAMQTVRIQ